MNDGRTRRSEQIIIHTAQPRAHPQKVNENNGFSQSFSIFYFFISRDYNNKYHHSLEGIANPPVSPCCLAAFFSQTNSYR